ncbi:MAG: ATP-binding protein [Oceanococcaceae bacterium]
MTRALPIQVLLIGTLALLGGTLLTMVWLYQEHNDLRADYFALDQRRLGVSRVLFAIEDRADQMQRLARLAASTGDSIYIEEHRALRETLHRFQRLTGPTVPANSATPNLDDDVLRDWIDALSEAQLHPDELDRLAEILAQAHDWSEQQSIILGSVAADGTDRDATSALQLRALTSPDQELANWRNGALLEELEYRAMQRLRDRGQSLRQQMNRMRYADQFGFGLFALITLLTLALFQWLMVRPLRDALTAAVRIGGGKYDERVQPRGVQETRELGATLNWMAEAIQSDIRAREDAERRARDTELRIRQVGDLAPGAIWSARWHPQARWPMLIYASAGFDRLYALGAEAIRAQPEKAARCLHSEDRANTYAAYQKSIETGADIDISQRTLRPDGEYRWTQVLAKVRREDNGSFVWNGFCMDIDELQQLRASTEDALRRAQAASEAKTSFLANISHEVRTPLNAIIGIADIARDDTKDAEQRRRFTRIHDSGQQLLRLLNDVLDTSKLDAGRMRLAIEDFVLADVIGHLRDLHEDTAQARGLALQTVIDAGCPAQLRGDALRLQQILGNLLSNAVKFTATGEVRLHVQWLTEDDARARVHAHASTPTRRRAAGSQAAHWIQFCVHDTGPGISADRLNLLFEPFTQADASISRTHGGTGLGLTIARQLAELMGGAISARSTPGRGSQFCLTLPFARSQSVLTATSSAAASRPALATLGSAPSAPLDAPLLSALREMITRGDAAARTHLPQHHGESLPAPLQRIQDALNAFDFEAALARLDALLSSTGHPVP